MRVLVCGAGKVGYAIAEKLSLEDHDIIVIDPSEDVINDLSQNLDVRVVNGSASSPSVLLEAVGEGIDVMLVLTARDEDNLLICKLADYLCKIPQKIARVRSIEFASSKFAYFFDSDHLNIDHIITPEKEIAENIYTKLLTPSAIMAVDVLEDKAQLLLLKCSKKSVIINYTISHLSNLLEIEGGSLLLSFFFGYNNELLLRNDIIYENDFVLIVIPTEKLQHIISIFNLNFSTGGDGVIIVGGGNVGYNLCLNILNSDSIFVDNLSIIESDLQRAEHIAAKLPDKVNVIHGNALSLGVLHDLGIQEIDTFIAVSNDDKVNIMSALLAQRNKCQNIVTLMNNIAYNDLLFSLGLETVVNPKLITMHSIMQKLRGKAVSKLIPVLNSDFEVLELTVIESSPVIGMAISTIEKKLDIIIGMIYRDGELIIAKNSTVQADDMLLILAQNKEFVKVSEYFKLL